MKPTGYLFRRHLSSFLGAVISLALGCDVLSAVIGNELVIVTRSFPIQVQVEPQDRGTVQAPATAAEGSVVRLIAEAKPGFVFSQWTINGGSAITNLPFDVRVTAALSVRAVFVPGITLNIESQGLGWDVAGTVSGGNVPAIIDEICSVTAIPGRYFDFAGWFENGLIVATNRIFSFVSDGGSRVLMARFVEKPVYEIELVPAPEYAGDLPFGYTPEHRDVTWSIEAAPRPGFRFEGWTSNLVWFTSKPQVNVILETNCQWIAHFFPTNQVIVTQCISNSPQRVIVPKGTNVVLAFESLISDWKGYVHAPETWFRWRHAGRLVGYGRTLQLTNIQRRHSGIYRLVLYEGPPHGARFRVVRKCSPVYLKVAQRNSDGD